MDAFSGILTLVFAIAASVPFVWSIIGLATGKSEFLWGVLGGAWAIVWLLVFFFAMAADWGGCGAAGENGVIWCCDAGGRPTGTDTTCTPTPQGCEGDRLDPTPCATGQTAVYAYCEVIGVGPVRQPWNTWSDLAFIVSGMWMLWWFGFSARTEDNPMTDATPLSVTYGAIVIFMGPASMLLHASMKDWAGWFDAFSVYTWMFFNAAYIIFSSWNMDRGWRTALTFIAWGVSFLLFGGLAFHDPMWRFLGIVISAGVWILFEILHVIFTKAVNVVDREWWYLGGVMLFLGLAMTFWIFWNPEVFGPGVCEKVVDFPGHALFHILAAVATFFVFVYHRSEHAVQTSTSGGTSASKGSWSGRRK